ncbi:MAG: hypothetical protein IKW45_02680 [Clostridia bacterium]|nr:hypothetical protein [Clostridia bacterium]
MAETKKKRKGTHKLAFPIGCIIVLLAAIGLVTVVISAVNGIDTAIDKSKHYEEYEKILNPVVLIDPDAFDDITKANMSQLIEISIWSLLKSDIDPDTFKSTENGLLIPKSAVEEEFVELFGTEVTPVHTTIDGYALEFQYDAKTENYTVPLTGVTPVYIPKVVDKTTTTDTVVLTVACLAGDAWEQDENGDMVEPSPDKYIKITLREKDENLYISALQSTTTPEVVTTEKVTETTTESKELIDQADVVAKESTTTAEEDASDESETDESESSTDTESTSAAE